MPTIPHLEKHFTASESVRDIVIGMADGLTVPFALAAGLSAAVSSTGVIVTAGMAEIAAGAIAMGLGGYLAAQSGAQHYASEYSREQWEIYNKRDTELQETAEIFRRFGLRGNELHAVVRAVSADKKLWADFMMRFELGLELPEPGRALKSAGTIAASYLVGGLIPLVPYMVNGTIPSALKVSVGVTGLALLVFGAVKGHFSGMNVWKSAIQTLLVGGLAAGAAFWLAHLIA